MSDNSNDAQPNDNPLDEDKTAKHCTFDEWIDYFFNHDAVTHEQYWEVKDYKEEHGLSCSNEDADYLVFFTRLFEEPVTSLSAFNDTQIDLGLWTVINEIGEGGIYALSNADLPWAERKRAIELMYNVYEQLFELRCEWNVDEKVKPLNSVCHMWWDIIGLGHNRSEISVTAIGVMERILTNLTNPFCWWSALHGLGHSHKKDKERIERIIDTFLNAHLDLDPWLRGYALAARTGSVK